MKKRIIAGFSLSIGLAANAQTINLRGQVTNVSGNPVANAIVAIARQGLKDTGNVINGRQPIPQGQNAAVGNYSVTTGAPIPDDPLLTQLGP